MHRHHFVTAEGSRASAFKSLYERAALRAALHIEGATDLDGINLRLKAEISRCALNLHMAQERTNRLQVASSFQNVQSFRPA